LSVSAEAMLPAPAGAAGGGAAALSEVFLDTFFAIYRLAQTDVPLPNRGA